MYFWSMLSMWPQEDGGAPPSLGRRHKRPVDQLLTVAVVAPRGLQMDRARGPAWPVRIGWLVVSSCTPGARQSAVGWGHWQESTSQNCSSALVGSECLSEDWNWLHPSLVTDSCPLQEGISMGWGSTWLFTYHVSQIWGFNCLLFPHILNFL